MTLFTTTDGGSPPPPAPEPGRGPLVIDLVPGPGGVHSPRRAEQRWLRASILLAVTFFTTTTIGAQWAWAVRTDIVINLGGLGVPLLSPRAIAMVWSDPELLRTGLQFSLPALLILLAHELGHYLACRRYRIDSTLPYFLPAPIAFGTFGAFIRLRSPLRNKRELFDVGIAGPIAGFVALVPFLLYGIALSPPALAPHPTSASAPVIEMLLPGDNLGFLLATRLFHGPLPESHILNLHPFALAAWLGMLATALNLIPLSQLDGGHILYAVAGARQRRIALPIWLGLALLGLAYPGWLLWAAVTLFLGLAHPPVADESQPLDGKRKALAVGALLMLALCLCPVPFEERLVDARALPVLAPRLEGARQIATTAALGELREQVPHSRFVRASAGSPARTSPARH